MRNDNKESIYKDYEQALCLVARQSAICQVLIEAKLAGEVLPDKKVIEQHFKLLQRAKENLLRLKEMLGYTDGLSFMEDVYLNGCSFVGGMLQGDLSKLPEIINPWFDCGDNFKHEVATLLMCHHVCLEDETYVHQVHRQTYRNAKREDRFAYMQKVKGELSYFFSFRWLVADVVKDCIGVKA